MVGSLTVSTVPMHGQILTVEEKYHLGIINIEIAA